MQVGACIVNPYKQVIAIGGSSVENPEELGQGKVFTTVTSLPLTNPYGKKIYVFVFLFYFYVFPIAHHAEYKTIASYNGKETLRGCTLYVTTAPCNVCAKLIAQSGIVEVVYGKELGQNDSRKDLTETIFRNCSIVCRFVRN